MNPDSAPSGEFAYLALASLYLHRSATTKQLHQLLCPGVSITNVTRWLRGLRAQSLVERIILPEPRNAQLFFLTEAGRAVAAEMPEVSDRPSPLQNLGDVGARILLPHTQAVLKTHLAFLIDARDRKDSYGPLDWAPETNHRWSEKKADAVRADALMRYSANRRDGRVHFRAFVEVDRATYGSEKLTAKLLAYARFYEARPVPLGKRNTIEGTQNALPGWRDHYPKFPRLLFVFAGGSRTTMLNRITDLQAATANNRRVTKMLQEVKAGAALLGDLSASTDRPNARPSAPVWTSLLNPDRPACSWMDL